MIAIGEDEKSLDLDSITPSRKRGASYFIVTKSGVEMGDPEVIQILDDLDTKSTRNSKILRAIIDEVADRYNVLLTANTKVAIKRHGKNFWQEIDQKLVRKYCC